ncbi:hypothetical protein M413DRAFT_444638 [Hebeloma cylindrosporum]|uniref:BHLH domain-containing protein n=1 Tax=Hebeloma cylindrosporum TaxID=76867 RepID=A0A0C3BZZ5_HEBCY|nr:hypothetical protein M413DRAFT_444638 [Hebeloma cylindrosporum h7]
MSAELGLDASDPLNLLLNNGDSSSDDSSQNENPQHDWSKFSALWADGGEQATSKPYSDIMDLSDLTHMSMDMDFNPSMAIEPSALHHFPSSNLNFTYDDQFNTLSSELLATQFPFMFQFGASGDPTTTSSSASPQFTKERRLSVTSSSSSSGASLSPVPESLGSPVPGGYGSDNIPPKEEPQQSEMYANDPAAELAQRVRQSAGVMLAVPMNAQLQGNEVTVPTSNPTQGKLPIPRFQHSPPKSSNVSTSSSAASTPPPSTPPLTSTVPFRLAVNTAVPPPTANMVSTPTPTSALPRPKTSHTTIERRYRTNLNARIQSLRMAVPALRVLEDREGGNGKKIKKNLKGSVLIKGSGNVVVEGEDGAVVDVIDERGFVDGVKVARKCSKANVLGKAVEYIRVLKKREQRLKAEQAGLKTLVSGLVGGPALVREWEKEWKAKFGGEEKDEVEGEDEEGDDEDSEDEEGEDGDDEPGKKRKRAKVATSAFPAKKPAEKKKPAPVLLVPNSDSGIPEKRKRGRPRKVLPPPVTFPVEQDEVMQPPTTYTATQHQQLHEWAAQQQQQQGQPQQFLLAVFALFSFFNSPLTSSWSSASSGHSPHTGTVLTAAHPPLAYAPEIISQFAAPHSAPIGWDWKEYVQLFHLFVSLLVLASFICSWLGLSFGSGIGKVVRKGQSFRPSVATPKKRQNTPTSWAKMGEESVLQGQASTLSLYERLQVYRSVKPDASVSDRTTLALVIASTTGALGGLAKVKARFIWDAAKDTETSKISEKLVFETLDMDEAAVCLSKATPSDGTEYTPVEALGVVVVKARVKKHLATLFANVVDDDMIMEGNEEEEEEDVQRRRTVEAARELGGQVAELGRTFERVWKVTTSGVDGGVLSFDHLHHPEEATGPGVDGEIKALVVALSLYRQLFPDAVQKDGCGLHSSLLSPPPSPSSKESVERGLMLLSLRKALGSRVFEDEVMGLEDARDRVVDMIVDADRRQRRSPTP